MLITPLLVALLTAGCLAASARDGDVTPASAGGTRPAPDGAGTGTATEEATTSARDEDAAATPGGADEPSTPTDPAEEPATRDADPATLRIPVQTHSGGPRLAASLKGRLSGAVGEHGTACLWVARSRGNLVLVWPAGYSAVADPLRVLDADGRTVATVGDQISLGGGVVRGRVAVDAEVLDACGHSGSFWLVGSVGRG